MTFDLNEAALKTGRALNTRRNTCSAAYTAERNNNMMVDCLLQINIFNFYSLTIIGWKQT